MVRSETPTAPTPGNVALFSAAIRRGPETTINARWVLRSISGVNLSQSAGLNGNSCAKSWLASASCSGSSTWKSSAADRYNLTVRGGLVTSADVIESVARRTCATLRRTPVAAAVQPVSQADAAGAPSSAPRPGEQPPTGVFSARRVPASQPPTAPRSAPSETHDQHAPSPPCRRTARTGTTLDALGVDSAHDR